MPAIAQSLLHLPSFEDVKGWALIEKLKAKCSAQRPRDGKCTKTPSRSSTFSTPPPSYREKPRSRAPSLISRAPSYEEDAPLTYINAAAFDGGGVRGAASAKIMSIIMDDLAEATGREEHAADHFDMFGGTSTGGLVAMMLGRLRVPTNALLEAYSDLSGRLFSSRVKLLRSIFLGCKYSATFAEKLFSQVVADHSIDGPNTLLHNAEDGSCHVFVTAVDAFDASGRPLVLRSYAVEDDGFENVGFAHRIADAARATTAAPAYFPPKVLENGQVAIDGGFSVNNPADLLVAEARRKHGPGVRFGLLLSVGTGEKAPMSLPSCTSAASIVSLTRAMGHILTDSEKTHRRVEERFQESDLGTYLRINVPDIGDVALDDYKAIPALLRATDEYMNTPEMLDVRKEVVQILLRTKDKS